MREPPTLREFPHDFRELDASAIIPNAWVQGPEPRLLVQKGVPTGGPELRCTRRRRRSVVGNVQADAELHATNRHYSLIRWVREASRS
jgi:hypothetical protein